MFRDLARNGFVALHHIMLVAEVRRLLVFRHVASGMVRGWVSDRQYICEFFLQRDQCRRVSYRNPNISKKRPPMREHGPPWRPFQN